MIYLTSDQHFGHKNIIKYTGRPFESLEEMDSIMIAKWNEKVSDKDVVIHLGDFGLSSSARLKEIIDQLNGRKIIILGNHDKSVTWYKNNGFEQAYNKSLGMVSRKTGSLFILSHEPVNKSDYCDRTIFNVHGHMHEKLLGSGDYLSICVEQHDYYPMSLQELGIAKQTNRLLKLIEYNTL